MDEYRIHREILCVDLKSFYASVECAERGLDPFKTPLIVADKSRGQGSIVLAVSPFLKAKGMPSRCRLHEVPDIEGLIVARPRMRTYLEVSRDIVGVYLSYVAPEDLHIYSIDEAFLDVTPYLNYYNKDARALAREILDAILKETSIPAACGIGDNMLLSKLALDLKSKKAPSGIAAIRYEDVERDLWPVTPLSQMWGIGKRMEKRLNALNIWTVGDLARYDAGKLRKRFGIIGEELYYHAHGIDQSIISEGVNRGATPKSVGLGQTLFRDYDATEIHTVTLEMVDEVAEKLRFLRHEAKTLHLSIGYSKAYGGGFSRQISFPCPTDSEEEIFEATWRLFRRHHENLPIRRISVRATNLIPKRAFEQISLFESHAKKRRRRKLGEALDALRRRYGKRSVMRLSSHLDAGTAKERSGLIGGHRE